jgi:hypothetical protein
MPQAERRGAFSEEAAFGSIGWGGPLAPAAAPDALAILRGLREGRAASERLGRFPRPG